MEVWQGDPCFLQISGDVQHFAARLVQLAFLLARFALLSRKLTCSKKKNRSYVSNHGTCPVNRLT